MCSGSGSRGERHGRGWSMERLAGASGVSRAMISKIERGESSPTAVLLGKLSAALELSVSELLTGARLGDGLEPTTPEPPPADVTEAGDATGAGRVRRAAEPRSGATRTPATCAGRSRRPGSRPPSPRSRCPRMPGCRTRRGLRVHRPARLGAVGRADADRRPGSARPRGRRHLRAGPAPTARVRQRHGRGMPLRRGRDQEVNRLAQPRPAPPHHGLNELVPGSLRLPRAGSSPPRFPTERHAERKGLWGSLNSS